VLRHSTAHSDAVRREAYEALASQSSEENIIQLYHRPSHSSSHQGLWDSYPAQFKTSLDADLEVQML